MKSGDGIMVSLDIIIVYGNVYKNVMASLCNGWLCGNGRLCGKGYVGGLCGDGLWLRGSYSTGHIQEHRIYEKREKIYEKEKQDLEENEQLEHKQQHQQVKEQ